MPSVLNLIPGALGRDQAQIVHAEVSTFQPVPASFSDPLYVVFPGYTPDYYFTTNSWYSMDGVTLPRRGAECLAVFDDQRSLIVFVKPMGAYSHPSPADLGIATGTGFWKWDGTGPTSTTNTVAHSLGRFPLSVQITPLVSSATSRATWGTFQLNANSFATNATTIDGSTPVAGTAVDFSWVAL